MDTAEKAQHFAESVSFVFCSELAVCCSWLHLLTAADALHVSPKLDKVRVLLHTVQWLLR